MQSLSRVNRVGVGFIKAEGSLAKDGKSVHCGTKIRVKPNIRVFVKPKTVKVIVHRHRASVSEVKATFAEF